MTRIVCLKLMENLKWETRILSTLEEMEKVTPLIAINDILLLRTLLAKAP